MRDLRPAVAQDHQPALRERDQHRVGASRALCASSALGARAGAGYRPAGQPAVVAHGRHPPEKVPRDPLLVLGQPSVDRLGAGLDGAGDPAGLVVACPGQPAVFAVFPGQRQGLGKHGERGTAVCRSVRYPGDRAVALSGRDPRWNG